MEGGPQRRGEKKERTREKRSKKTLKKREGTRGGEEKIQERVVDGPDSRKKAVKSLIIKQ